MGTQTESFQTHKADVLCLCLAEDENSVYCAGKFSLDIFVSVKGTAFMPHLHCLLVATMISTVLFSFITKILTTLLFDLEV
jgi:hypothetical protein